MKSKASFDDYLTCAAYSRLLMYLAENLHSVISEIVGGSKPEARAASRVVDSSDRLHGLLDDLVSREYPDAVEDSLEIFYLHIDPVEYPTHRAIIDKTRHVLDEYVYLMERGVF